MVECQGVEGIGLVAGARQGAIAVKIGCSGQAMYRARSEFWARCVVGVLKLAKVKLARDLVKELYD